MAVKQLAQSFGPLNVLTINSNGKKTSTTQKSPSSDGLPRDFHYLGSFLNSNEVHRKPALGQVPHTIMPTAAQTKQDLPAALCPTSACSPRSSRSSLLPPLVLNQSNGFTHFTTAELKQSIQQSRSTNDSTLTQIPTDTRKPLPPTPTSPHFIMGNKPSSEAGSPVPDDRSQRSVVRNPKPVSRKGSYNVFRRVDSRSPLPRDVTASVMSILHRDGQKRDDDFGDTDDDGPTTVNSESTYVRPERHDSRFPPGMSKANLHSTSTTTMTEEKASQPLSASTTIRDFRAADQNSVRDAQLDGADDDEGEEATVLQHLHSTSLSPTIPAPSPLPEDSPHKYGLRDKMDTPELPEPAKGVDLPKARRKSSGLEIFNEAKTLQSAASFLNGLSTSRRRAESAAAEHTTDTSNSGWTGNGALSRPSSARPPSTRPSGQYPDGEGRRKGHNFKSSGFAYTRPLSLAQIKCYRGHSRLLMSRNKHAPVECAVCHIDDDGEHFSCSWCAIRMCKYCRKDFAQRGMTALRERIKTAEIGGAESSNESLNFDFERGSKSYA